jgi:hypothetical protein
MNMKTLAKTAAGALALTAFLVPLVHAQDSEAAKIVIGMQVAPVPLDMKGKDANLVGLGSYLVNVGGECNGCHSAGPPTQFAAGGNPYQGQRPAKTNPATYLGGSRDFGAFPDPAGPHIVSRNLTPDKSGLPLGGDSYAEFVQLIRTGVDPDHAHPTCVGARDAKCIPAPFDGNLLQIMPWPAYQFMTDHDLQAIYEYLRSIPCVEGGPGQPPNRCATTGVKTAALAGPKTATVVVRELVLDGTGSTAADGKPLTYAWSVPQGYPSVGLLGATSATPTVQFGTSRGTYAFQLTVTDSTGKSASDVVMVNYQGN